MGPRWVAMGKVGAARCLSWDHRGAFTRLPFFVQLMKMIFVWVLKVLLDKLIVRMLNDFQLNVKLCHDIHPASSECDSFNF